MTSSPAPRRSLSGLVVRGAGWTAGSQLTVQVLAIVTSIAIARLLTPFEVGLAAEALVFGTLALVIVDSGLGTAIVQRPNLTEVDRSTAFWAGLALGAALTGLGFALSWPIADLYGEPEVQPLFAVLSLGFLFTAPGVVQAALLARELSFRSLEIRTLIATTFSCAGAILLAALGAGPWAIVGQNLIITAVSTALLWRSSPWRPRAMFSAASLRGMSGYAGNVLGSNVLTWATINVDNFLVGRYVGTAPLGAYTLAFSTMVMPVLRIAEPVTNVLFPAFAKVREPRRIAGMWLRAARMVAVVVVPVMLGLIAVAPDLIPAVFGKRWEAAIPVVQILAPVGLIQALMGLNTSILQAVDRTRLLFRFNVALAIVTIAAFAAGIPWGLEGVATGYLAATLVMQPIYLRLTAREIRLPVRDWIRSVARVALAGAGMLGAVLLAREALLETSLPIGLRLAALVVVGAVVYVPLVLALDREVMPEVRGLRGHVRGAG